MRRSEASGRGSGPATDLAEADRARQLLAERLRVPEHGGQRERMNTRLANLRKQHEWGDLTDEQYLSGKREVEAMLAALPTGDKLVLFDRYRKVM